MHTILPESHPMNDTTTTRLTARDLDLIARARELAAARPGGDPMDLAKALGAAHYLLTELAASLERAGGVR